MDWLNTAINFFFIVLFWIWSDDAYERETPIIGFLYLVLSAANAATIGVRYL